MRVSQYFLTTLKEAPAEAELASHRLMLRSGMIKRLAAGIYTWLPLGLRVLRKVEAVVREEMNASGAIELLMPVVQPAELWQESGRWDKYGPELLRLKDRHQRDFIVQPTSEEAITDLARKEIKSYKQLPLNLYHIQTKFRDEVRPRFGVMRSREFIMKDAYSFDVDNAANVELAEAVAPHAHRAAPAELMQKVATPGLATCEQVAHLLHLPLGRTVKCIMLNAGGKVHMLLIRGDHSLNEIKAAKVPRLAGFRWATDSEIVAATGCSPGYLGPVGIDPTMPLIVDRTVAVMSDFICGANEADYHLRGVNFGRDCREPDIVADIRNVVSGDPSPDGKGTLDIVRGIEVGHVFALGTEYSKAMGATFLDAGGQSRTMEMGCYGIGITRIVAAAIEQNFDQRGITWPAPLAPFTVAIAPIAFDRNEAVRAASIALHDELCAAGFEVLLDDRGERPGVMFADLELIGIPHRITVGERGLKEGKVEYQSRRDTAATAVPMAEIVALVRAGLQS